MDIRCRKCGKTLPVEEFHVGGGGYLDTVCNACRSLRIAAVVYLKSREEEN